MGEDLQDLVRGESRGNYFKILILKDYKYSSATNRDGGLGREAGLWGRERRNSGFQPF